MALAVPPSYVLCYTRKILHQTKRLSRRKPGAAIFVERGLFSALLLVQRIRRTGGLTNGEEILRVVISRFNDWGDSCSYKGVEIIVGRAGERDMVSPHEDDDVHTLWNSHLEVLRQERFYQVGES